MWHASIRVSLDKDTGSKIRNKMKVPLETAGFVNVTTGTWELYAASSSAANQAMQNALAIIEQSGKLDHYWIRVEKLSLPQMTRLLKAAKALVSP